MATERRHAKLTWGMWTVLFASRGKTRKDLSKIEVRAYLLHLLQKQEASHAYVNQCISALKFLYGKVLKQPSAIVNLPRPKRERKLPDILSWQEVLRLLEAVENPKHRTIMLLTYSAGLRLVSFAESKAQANYFL